MIALDDTGHGPAVVLIHGVGTSRIVWRRITPGLSRRRRVLAPDVPGLGESPAISHPFDLAAVARALAEELAPRVDAPFELVGTSLGGAIALELAHLNPELVRCLVLVAPAGFSARPWPLPVLAGTLAEPAISLRRLLGTPVAGSAHARRAVLWGTIAEPHKLRPQDARTMLAGSRNAVQLGSAIRAALRADLREHLETLDRPLGLMWGRRDRVVPLSVLERLQALRPDALVETIPGAGHVPQLERPAQFAVKIRRLLARLDPDTS